MNEAIIEVEHLSRSFGSFTAVNDISFQVAPAEIFAFLGPNGAGKTTTIKVLTTLLRPTAGVVRIAGHDPVTDQAAVRRAFGIVFQDPSLDDELTATENLEFHGVLYGLSRQVRRKRIDQMLKLVELVDRRDDLVKHFSGGMKRRLEIARGLLHHPRVLFLDEPTLGLDPQTRAHLWDYVRELNRSESVTIFLTTHLMEEAERVAKRIAIIDHGQLVAQGTTTELKRMTKTRSLEEAFLAITGRTIRAETADATDRLRVQGRIWGRGRVKRH